MPYYTPEGVTVIDSEEITVMLEHIIASSLERVAIDIVDGMSVADALRTEVRWLRA